ncbi:uncharacterized protein O3C94_018618 [Discoglossus pictus]
MLLRKPSCRTKSHDRFNQTAQLESEITQAKKTSQLIMDDGDQRNQGKQYRNPMEERKAVSTFVKAYITPDKLLYKLELQHSSENCGEHSTVPLTDKIDSSATQTKLNQMEEKTDIHHEEGDNIKRQLTPLMGKKAVSSFAKSYITPNKLLKKANLQHCEYDHGEQVINLPKDKDISFSPIQSSVKQIEQAKESKPDIIENGHVTGVQNLNNITLVRPAWTKDFTSIQLVEFDTCEEVVEVEQTYELACQAHMPHNMILLTPGSHKITQDNLGYCHESQLSQ